MTLMESPSKIRWLSLSKNKSSYQGQSSNPFAWALVNFVVAVILSVDINCGFLLKTLSIELYIFNSILKYIEIGFAVLFGWNTLFDVLIYLWPMMSQKPVQEALFGGFETSEVKEENRPSAEPTSTPLSQHKFINLVLPASNNASPSFTSTPCKSMMSNSSFDCSSASWANNSLSSSPNLSLTSSWSYVPGKNSPHYPVSRDNSFHHSTDSPETLRMRRNILNSSFMSQCEFKTTDEKSLENYIKDLESTENKNQPLKYENQASFNYVNNMMNTSSVLLRKYQYLPACRSPQSSTALADDPDFLATYSGDLIWSKFDISESQLNTWNQNLRKWLSQTLLMPLVAEINNINDVLYRLGSPDLQIGDVSHSSLRQIVLTKGQHVPTLTTLIPYLEISNNQEYLVQRMKDLAKGGGMSELRWHSGGQFKGKSWTDELPTDCAVIMHLLCSYMDSRLPPNPMYPDGKTFTSQYFRKTPDKPIMSKDSLCIFQTRINPPHFRLIIEEETWDIPKGRSNMLNTILFFLHHVKTVHCGMLGRINLGPSGVNILWVVEG